jgi:hypothetical protein
MVGQIPIQSIPQVDREKRCIMGILCLRFRKSNPKPCDNRKSARKYGDDILRGSVEVTCSSLQSVTEARFGVTFHSDGF